MVKSVLIGQTDNKSLRIRSFMQENQYDTIIAGGGIAGLVTALELLSQDKSNQQKICIVDRDSKEKLGGLARWAFGGMALSATKQQKKMAINDNPEILLNDWLSFAEFNNTDYWPKCWAKEYAENNHEKVYLWLKNLGIKFLPAVNWVERGLFVPGNSVPRYHVMWGTGWELVEVVIKKLQPFIENKQLLILHQHKVLTPIYANKNSTEQVCGAEIENETTAQTFSLQSKHLVIACGGINGSVDKVRANWYKPWGKAPSSILNGANPISDGALHEKLAKHGANLTRIDNMWNYAAGIPHPQAEFDGHGLSLIPCKSALWMDHTGKRIGPQPLVTGFDTHYLCEQVAKQEKPWTWQLLNKRIALKELAVSGSLHNPSIRDKKIFTFLKEILWGNHRLVKQLLKESDDFICANNLTDLVTKMNAQTDEPYIEQAFLAQQISKYDQGLKKGYALENDDQVRRIHHARQWRPDKLRTCKPAPILAKNNGPLIAIKVQLISRKSLGGVQTNLASQVLNQNQQVIKGLYCVGEAAGFGGGGASGKRSLEGTFLSGCILTARNAADAIINESSINNK